MSTLYGLCAEENEVNENIQLQVCLQQKQANCTAIQSAHDYLIPSTTMTYVHLIVNMLAVQVCWSDDGERFSGLGDGGVVATWRLDAPRMQASDTGYLGRSDWCHQVCFSPNLLSKHLPVVLHQAALGAQHCPRCFTQLSLASCPTGIHAILFLCL